MENSISLMFLVYNSWPSFYALHGRALAHMYKNKNDVNFIVGKQFKLIDDGKKLEALCEADGLHYNGKTFEEGWTGEVVDFEVHHISVEGNETESCKAAKRTATLRIGKVAQPAATPPHALFRG